MTRLVRLGVSFLTCLALSAAAVALFAGLTPLKVNGVCANLLEGFASPGELLWWATLGGAFSGHPQDAAGYAVWILGSTLFWFLAVLAALPMLTVAKRGNPSP